jgi:hypothetical protein
VGPLREEYLISIDQHHDIDERAALRIDKYTGTKIRVKSITLLLIRPFNFHKYKVLIL